MKNILSSMFVILCFTLLPAFSETLTYRDYLTDVLAGEESLTELVDRLNKTSERGSFLQGWRNPQIRGQYGENDDTSTDLDTGFITEETRTGYEVEVRVYPPNPFEVSSERSQAEADYLQLQSAVYEASRERFASIHEEWAEAFRATKLSEVYAGFSPFWEEMGRLLNDRETAASMSESDLLDWRIEWLEFMSIRRNLEQKKQRYIAALARRLHRADDALLPASGHPEPEVELLPEADLDLALADVKRNLQNATSDLQSARSDHWPWISHIQGSYGEVESDFDREGWSVQVAVDIPVFTWFSGEISRNKTAVMAAKTMLKEREHHALLEKEGMIQSYTSKKEKLADYEENVLPWLEDLKDILANPDIQSQVALKEQIRRVKTVLDGYSSYYDLKLKVSQEEANLVREGLARLKL